MEEKIRVFVWGNGLVGKKFLEKAAFRANIDWGGVCESVSKEGLAGYKEIAFEKGDIIIIATSARHTDEILKTILADTNVDVEHIVTLSPTPYSIRLGVGKKKLNSLVSNIWECISVNNRQIVTMATASDFEREYIGDSLPDYEPPLHDYVRINTFDLCTNEIINRKIGGAVAELGVFQGDFAKYINKKFPERKFYLFDTFEGFDEEQLLNLDSEKEKDFYRVRFGDTSIQRVLDKMCTPDNCVVKKGYFPESLEGLEEEFAFVSLDADLKEPIYEGLKYFYPRLVKGGYIFVHDYNNWSVVSNQVKAAVQQYEEEFHSLVKIPIADRAGSLIIAK